MAKIAENHLTPGAAKKVQELIAPESLPRVSVWADETRSDPDRKRFDPVLPWHFAQIPAGQTYDKAPKNPEGDVVTAMQKMEAVLRDQKASREQKAEALKLLVHFAGDAHQPLHAGVVSDQGGLRCMVRWHHAVTNLHQLWDEGFIRSTELSYTEYAQFLDHPTQAEISAWQKGSYADWAEESRKLLGRIYPPAVPAEVNLPGHPYCKSDERKRIPRNSMPDLGYRYVYEFLPVVEERLTRAGIRLAGVLNSIFK